MALGRLVADLCGAHLEGELIGRIVEQVVFGPAYEPGAEAKSEPVGEPYRPPEIAAKADMWASTMVDEREAEPGAVPQDAYGLKTSEDVK